MAFTSTNYELIGMFPEVEEFRDSLDMLISDYRAIRVEMAKASECRYIGTDAAIFQQSEEEIYLTAKYALMQSQLRMAAAHFYGIDNRDVDGPEELILAIEDAENAQELGNIEK